MTYKCLDLKLWKDAFEILENEANLNDGKNCISFDNLKIGRGAGDLAETVEIICNGMESWGWNLVAMDDKMLIFRK